MNAFKIILLSLAIPLGVNENLSAQSQDKAPEVDVNLQADRSAVTPDGELTLAVRFKIEQGWHIYWQNRGEGGLEPRFDWQFPKGFTLQNLHYPPPKRYVDATGAHTFILEGTPVILADVKVSKDAKVGQKAAINLKLSWLACKKVCVLGDESLSIQLPVVKSADQVKPTNEQLFRRARKALPAPMDQPPHLEKLSAAADVNKIKPGTDFKVAVILHLNKQMHVNAHKPSAPQYIPTDLFPHKTDGLNFNRSLFPPGKTITFFGQKLLVYGGKTVLVLPVQADQSFTGDKLTISGVVTYQACNEKTGMCFPPTAANWSLSLPVAAKDETVPKINSELFGGNAEELKQPPPDQTTAAITDDEKKAGPTSTVGFSLDRDIQATVQQPEHALYVWLLLALLAGAVLNITPCVLPVIAIKVLSFVQQASESPARVLKLGLAFSAGMLLVFNVLAALATLLGLVWGQHFQSPTFTIAMTTIVFAFALSVFGVYTIGLPQFVGQSAGKVEGEGYIGSFGKGALATIMGTPCLGPFLGSVLIWVSTQPPAMVFLIFNTIGIGMALPYIILTAHPRWLRFIPKPGPWLHVFKEAMGFLLMGTVIYLLSILNGQLGGRAVVWTLVFLMGVALACWIIGTWFRPDRSSWARVSALASALAVVVLTGCLSFGNGVDFNNKRTVGARANAQSNPDKHKLPWIDFSMEKLNQLTSQNQMVLLDITADWCPNCKANTKFVFNTEQVARAVEKYNAVPMLADWTARDETIRKLIDRLAPGASIPLCAVFPPGKPNQPIVMLGIVTRDQVVSALQKAASM